MEKRNMNITQIFWNIMELRKMYERSGNEESEKLESGKRKRGKHKKQSIIQTQN